MRWLMSIFFALTLCSAVVWSQSSSSSQGASGQAGQSTQNQSAQSSQTSSDNAQQQMSGNVSSNGKTFTDQSDNKRYKVDNPDALKGHEGGHVGLLVQVDPKHNTIHIVQVAP